MIQECRNQGTHHHHHHHHRQARLGSIIIHSVGNHRPEGRCGSERSRPESGSPVPEAWVPLPDKASATRFIQLEKDAGALSGKVRSQVRQCQEVWVPLPDKASDVWTLSGSGRSTKEDNLNVLDSER